MANYKLTRDIFGKSVIIDQDEIIDAIWSASWERDFTDPDAWGEFRRGYLCSVTLLPSGSPKKGRTAEEAAADAMWLHELEAMAAVIGLGIMVEGDGVWVTEQWVWPDSRPENPTVPACCAVRRGKAGRCRSRRQPKTPFRAL